MNRRRSFTSHTLPLALLAVLWPGVVLASEPVIGGPCEGCEYVFVGLPSELSSHARIAPLGESGEPLVLTGVVTTQSGVPAPDIVVYAYHTDAGGVYPRGTTRHGRLRGWVRTDAAGRYSFDSIRPGAYPNRKIPQHVHLHVIEPGRGTYWIDDVLFDDDPLLTPEVRRQARHRRGGDGLAVPEKDARGVWQVRRDVTLGSNVPGYE
jgi:protocatechuate 3,4-dioxygenase, beta subunit